MSDLSGKSHSDKRRLFMSLDVSISARRSWLIGIVDELVESGAFPESGIVACSPNGGTAVAVKRFLETAQPANRGAVARELNAAEDAAAERRRRDEREREREADRVARDTPLRDDEPAAIAARDLLEDAERAAEAAN